MATAYSYSSESDRITVMQNLFDVYNKGGIYSSATAYYNDGYFIAYLFIGTTSTAHNQPAMAILEVPLNATSLSIVGVNLWRINPQTLAMTKFATLA